MWVSCFIIIALVALVVSAQDLLFYPSSVSLNGTERLIETHPFCVNPAVQFNGSSSLFAGNRIVWVYQKNFFEANGTFQRVRPDYASYLVNPTVVPVTTAWWAFPCNIGDVVGKVSQPTYIPYNASYALTSTCEIELPIVFVCEGNVPVTNSPSKNPSRNPTQPSKNPSGNPSANPTRMPTKLPTSGSASCECWVTFLSGMIVMWAFGGNKI